MLSVGSYDTVVRGVYSSREVAADAMAEARDELDDMQLEEFELDGSRVAVPVVVDKMVKPPKPPARFTVGDRVVPADDVLVPMGKVMSVDQKWVSGEWREFISYWAEGGGGGGNADCFAKIVAPTE